LFDAPYHGENIAIGYRTSSKIFEAKRNTRGHIRNMLAQHTLVGLGQA